MEEVPPLLEAALSGNLPEVQRLCAVPGIDVNAADEYGYTALHRACINGHAAVVEQLCAQSGTDVNAKDNDGYTPLHYACINGDAAVVEHLCAQPSIDVNSENVDGRTPLQHACIDGHKAVVEHLCARPGINVNAKDTIGATGLHHACINGRAAVVEHLCAQLSIDVSAADNDGYTPLHRACINDHAAVVEHLCAQPSIDINAMDKYGYTPLHHACMNGHTAVVERLCAQPNVDVNAKDKYGYTPLHYACLNGRVAVVEHLCAQPSIDVNAKDIFGSTPLQRACSNDHTSVVKQLCRQPGIDVNGKDHDGYTALHYACIDGHASVVKELCEQPIIDINAQDYERRTALHHACSQGHSLVVAYLLALPIDVNSKDKDGRTPLHLACVKGDDAVVEQLLSHKIIDPDAKDDGGRTPLHLACIKGRDLVVEHLLALPIDVNAQDKDGRTPLHDACVKGRDAVVERLLSRKGIDINAEDNNEHTPLHHACSSGHTAVVEHLCAQPSIDPDSVLKELLADETASPTAMLRWNESSQQLRLSHMFAHNPFLARVPHHLPTIRKLVVDGGDISPLTKLPAMSNVQHVEVRGCPLLQCPPPHVMREGPAAAAAYLRDLAAALPRDLAATYLRDLAQGDTRECRKLRVMLVGAAGAGKSSFADALRACAARGEAVALPGRSAVDCTVGIDVSWFVVKRGDSGVELELSCWDCSGQVAYHATHTLFMAPQGLYALVVRLDEGAQAAVASAQVWLDAINTAVPSARVLLVCTRADHFVSWLSLSATSAMAQARAVANEVHAAMARSLQQRKDWFDAQAAAIGGEGPGSVAARWRQSALSLPVLLPAVACVSATSGFGVAEALQHIVDAANDDRVFPHLSVQYPGGVLRLLDRVQRGASTTDVSHDADDTDGEAADAEHDRLSALGGVAAWEAFRDAAYEASGFSADAGEVERDSTMRAAVELAHNSGLLVCFPRTQYVFLDPRWLVDAIKAIISHNYSPVALETSHCFSCGEAFWWLRLQHRCRRCYRSFCDACSRGRLPVPERGVFPPQSARVCDACAAVLSERPLDSERFVGMSAEDTASDIVQLQTTGLLTRRLLCGSLWWSFDSSVHAALVEVLCGDFALLVPLDDAGAADDTPSGESAVAASVTDSHKAADAAGAGDSAGGAPRAAGREHAIPERFWVPLLFPPAPEAQHGWQLAPEGAAALHTHRRLMVFDFLPFGFMERLIAQWLRQAAREDTGFSVDSDHRWRDAVQLRRTTPAGCEVVRVTVCQAPANINVYDTADADAALLPVLGVSTRRDLSLRIVAWLEPRPGEQVRAPLDTWGLTASVLQSIDDMRTTWFKGCPTPQTYAPCPSCVQRGTPQPHMFAHLTMLRLARVDGNGGTDVCGARPPCCGERPAVVAFHEVFPVHDVDTVRLREALGETERRVEDTTDTPEGFDSVQPAVEETAVLRRTASRTGGGGGGGSVMPVDVPRSAAAVARGGAGGAVATSRDSHGPSGAAAAPTARRGASNKEKLRACVEDVLEAPLRAKVYAAARAMYDELAAEHGAVVCDKVTALRRVRAEIADTTRRLRERDAKVDPTLLQNALRNRKAEERSLLAAAPCGRVVSNLRVAVRDKQAQLTNHILTKDAATSTAAAEAQYRLNEELSELREKLAAASAQMCAVCAHLVDLHKHGRPQWGNSAAHRWTSAPPHADDWFQVAKLFVSYGATELEPAHMDCRSCVTLVEMCTAAAFDGLRSDATLGTLRGLRQVRNHFSHKSASWFTAERYEEGIRAIDAAAATIAADDAALTDMRRRIEDIATNAVNVRVYHAAAGGAFQCVRVTVRGTLPNVCRLIREACGIDGAAEGHLEDKHSGRRITDALELREEQELVYRYVLPDMS